MKTNPIHYWTREITIYNRVTKIPKTKNLNDTNYEEKQQSSRQNFTGDTHYVICDTLLVKIQKRRETFIAVETRFGFLIRKNLSRNEIKTEIKTLMSMYKNELDFESNFID